ncbi:MAG: hypothetical protein V4465_00295 [Patescibacteria group bacterium]
MKKFFSRTIASLLVITFIFSIGVAPILVHAQSNPPCTDGQKQASDGKCYAPGTKAADAAGVTNSDNVNSLSCALPQNWISCGLTYIANAVLGLSALLTGIGGTILNFVVLKTVIQMKINYPKTVIDSAWTTIRDIANMGFIFVLLYTAILTIFGQGKYRQTIVNIIIAGILVNFSLFFTKFVIDVANLIAITFYNAIAPGAANSTIGISDAFMQAMHVTSLYKAAGTINSVNIISIGVLGSIVLIIAAFIFFAISIMFVVRYVVLIFVLIFSPIYFVSMVLPGLGSYKKQWEQALTGQAFFAPVYFMMTWVTLKVFNGISDSLFPQIKNMDATKAFGTVNAAAGVTGYFSGLIEMLVGFAILIGFLILSLIVSKGVADSSGKGVSKLTSFATGAVMGATAGAGRRTLGRAGQALSENEYLKSKAPDSRLARLALGAANKSAGATFDVRGTTRGGLAGGGKAGGKGGFAKMAKDSADAEKEYADKTFKPSDLVVASAEAELKAAQKIPLTDPERDSKIAKAQADVDRLKGADEGEMRKRKARELRLADPTLTEKEARKQVQKLEDQHFSEVATLMKSGMTEDDAKKKVKERREAGENVGWNPEEIKSNANDRKERYAKGIAEQKTFGMNADLTGRHLIFGPVKRERKLEALAIRKSMKEKSNKDKIAEAASAMAKEDSDKDDTAPAAAPAGGAPAGGTPPSTPKP